MIKIISIFLLGLYIFGIAKLGFVYTTHDIFHHIGHEEHSEKDCNGSCTIIIEAEKCADGSATKSYKINIDNFSSHIITDYGFTPALPVQNFIIQNIISSPPFLSSLDTPPPRI